MRPLLPEGGLTMIPREAIPDEVGALRDDLCGRGYRVAEARYYDEHFGNVIVLLEGDVTRILLVRDRDFWSIDVEARRLDGKTRRPEFGIPGDWFPPEKWRAFLNDSTEPVDAVPFAASAAWLLEDLSRIEDLGALNGEQLAAIRAVRWRES